MIKEFRGEFAFLSNFFQKMSPIEIDGIQYPTVEHAYQASKTLNRDHRRIISKLETPALAKRAGNSRGYNGLVIELRQDWQQVKIDVMSQCLIRKFEQPELKRMLLNTGESYLAEGNWWNDKFWGWCLKTNSGLNMLGRLLMLVRNYFSVLEKMKQEF